MHQNPDITYSTPEGKPCRIGQVGHHRIKMVLAPDDDELVITAWIES